MNGSLLRATSLIMVASGGLSTGSLPISKAFRVAISRDVLLLVLNSEVIMAYSSGIPEGT